MGVEPRLNCPDRSWCGAQTPDTSQGGDTGRADSRDKLLQERLRDGGERNCFEEKGVSERNGEWDVAGSSLTQPLPRATTLHFVALRAANGLLY